MVLNKHAHKLENIRMQEKKRERKEIEKKKHSIDKTSKILKRMYVHRNDKCFRYI